MSTKTSSNVVQKASKDAATQQETYSAPKVVTLGKAVRLVQLFASGPSFDAQGHASRTWV